MPTPEPESDWVRCAYHQFFLTPELIWPGRSPDAPNGLVVGGDSGFVAVRTGIHTGCVRVNVQALHDEPPVAHDNWEDVAETSVAVGDPATLMVTSEDASNADSFPNLSAAGPGTYRVRVHARGRMLDYDGSESRSREEYLIQVWPAAPADDSIVKINEAYAKQTGMTGGPIPPFNPPRPPGPPMKRPPGPQPQHCGGQAAF